MELEKGYKKENQRVGNARGQVIYGIIDNFCESINDGNTLTVVSLCGTKPIRIGNESSCLCHFRKKEIQR